MKPPIFNDYDDEGYRINKNGNRSSRIADDNLVSNLRFRWREELYHLPDAALVNLYDDFALSEYEGDNDSRFLEFVEMMNEAEASARNEEGRIKHD